MNTYEEVRDFQTAWLTSLGYGTTNNPPMPFFAVGPVNDADVLDLSPGAMVILSPYAGPGLTLEGLFDRVGWQAQCVGDQSDYNGAERLAADVDRGFISVDTSQQIGAKRVLMINRAGGRPTLQTWDVAERYQFMCSYIVTVESGV